MRAYYNDNSLEAVRWLQWLQLYAAIAPGRLDSRSIHDVRPEDLEGVTRAHFFAGIAGWDYALQLARWPEDRPIWTASLPCQPFSVAGQQRGTEDERHLWPVFRDLVAQCRPAALFGEQVSSPAGRSWLASVQTDLEALGYSTAAADLCAAGIGAPHVRQRLYWVAYNEVSEWSGGLAQSHERHTEAEGLQRSGQQRLQSQGGGADSGLGDPGGAGSGRLGGSVPEEKGNGRPERSESRGQPDESLAAGFRVWDDKSSSCSRVSDTGRQRTWGKIATQEGSSNARPDAVGELSPPARSFDVWDDIVFVPCGDGKARPIKPGIEPLVNGVPNRLGRIRGYGNSIVPQVAAVFIRSVMDVLEGIAYTKK